MGAGLLGLGVLSRPVAASMSATMIVAVIFHGLNTGGEAFPLGVPKAHSYNFELAAMYVFVLGYFTANGAGKYSVDEQILGGESIFTGVSSPRSSATRRSDSERTTPRATRCVKGAVKALLAVCPAFPESSRRYT